MNQYTAAIEKSRRERENRSPTNVNPYQEIVAKPWSQEKHDDYKNVVNESRMRRENNSTRGGRRRRKSRKSRKSRKRR